MRSPPARPRGEAAPPRRAPPRAAAAILSQCLRPGQRRSFGRCPSAALAPAAGPRSAPQPFRRAAPSMASFPPRVNEKLIGEGRPGRAELAGLGGDRAGRGGAAGLPTGLRAAAIVAGPGAAGGRPLAPARGAAEARCLCGAGCSALGTGCKSKMMNVWPGSSLTF